MIYRLLISAMTIFSLANCQNQNTANSANSNENTTGETTPTSPQKEIIYLKEGQNLYLKEYKMNVTFKKMIEDSRCPKDVQCVWAGNATAEVEFMGVSTRPMVLQFSTMNDANRGYFTKQNFNGYTISLVEVSPETTSGKGFKDLQGSYKIGLRFEKATEENPSTQRGGVTTK
ncbi:MULTISPECIES: hypothetical protein [unclassified Kaistella]|uniref:hypothetical protein n=1 Tax=unclassified Kaistella TaxID=2762626 RepID=UPI0027372C13|nr:MULTISPECIES: hypothetical protein [unclassified Kaistella]MDP2453734.1 hypothetical protein [Kaistella sp. SH11-4b]MDP2456791.1 hypothetical protein [Kaistella sp. SH40-3]MDP2459547.1 hypothetical protein [Kaistella sp. SH19-2b]